MITGSNGRMEVPPGRLLLRSSGGQDALLELLSEASKRRLNGVLRTERVRDDEPADGLLVFKDGNGTLAAHSWRDDLDGPLAIPAIVRDALEDDALLELRSYDHRASAVRPEQLKAKAAAMKEREKRLRALEAEVEAKRAELDRIREGLKKL